MEESSPNLRDTAADKVVFLGLLRGRDRVSHGERSEKFEAGESEGEGRERRIRPCQKQLMCSQDGGHHGHAVGGIRSVVGKVGSRRITP